MEPVYETKMEPLRSFTDGYRNSLLYLLTILTNRFIVFIMFFLMNGILATNLSLRPILMSDQ